MVDIEILNLAYKLFILDVPYDNRKIIHQVVDYEVFIVFINTYDDYYKYVEFAISKMRKDKIIKIRSGK